MYECKATFLPVSKYKDGVASKFAKPTRRRHVQTFCTYSYEQKRNEAKRNLRVINTLGDTFSTLLGATYWRNVRAGRGHDIAHHASLPRLVGEF